jgi:hypothetical protein
MYCLFLRFFLQVLDNILVTISNDEREFAVEPDCQPYPFDLYDDPDAFAHII